MSKIENKHLIYSVASPRRVLFFRSFFFAIPIAFLTQSCSTTAWPPQPIVVPDRTTRGEAGTIPLKQGADSGEVPATKITSLPQPPRAGEAARSASPSRDRDTDTSSVREATVSLQSVALPQFIETVFSTILKRNVSIDPQILQRREVVSLKTGRPQTAEQLFVTARAVLRSYGVSVQEFDGLLRFLPDNADSGYMPEIRRGRANPDVPDSLRPVFHLVELESTTAGNAASWLRSIFQAKITVQDDSQRNTLLISGAPAAVSAAMEALLVLDQPLMRGRISARVAPAYMTADELARRLNEALTAEGYLVSTTPGAPSPILVIPVGSVNAIFIFASSHDVLNHVISWATQFDQPSQLRSGNYVIYSARNTDAATLAKTLQDVVGGGATAGAGASSSGAVSPGRSSKIVVNPATNSLIIQASPSEFQQWRDLLEVLDRPARSALISVTVADVTLSDTESLGVSFEGVLQTAILKGLKFVVSSGSGGLSGAWLRTNSTVELPQSEGSGWTAVDPKNPKAVISALAQLNKTRILSNPSVLTRSGETATISVGSDIPTLSSTITSTVGGTQQQLVQYRKTGVTLKVKPVVHSSGRIDLEVSQEVSDQTGSGVSGSPIIRSTNLDTKLTVSDGGTVILGGLMSANNGEGTSGTPGLKDIPGLGHLFKTSTNSLDKRELVMLVTAYAVEDEYDAQAISEAFRSKMPWISPFMSERSGAESRASGGGGAVTAPSSSKPSILDLRESQEIKREDSTAVMPALPGMKPAGRRTDLPQVPQSSPVVPAAATPTRERLQTSSGSPEVVPAAPGKAVTNPDLLNELRRAVEGSAK